MLQERAPLLATDKEDGTKSQPAVNPLISVAGGLRKYICINWTNGVHCSVHCTVHGPTKCYCIDSALHTAYINYPCCGISWGSSLNTLILQ